MPLVKLSRTDRLDLLARVLRDRPGITAADAARELGVSVRSIFRDIDHLRERGYPIDASRGRGGGMRIHSSWGLGKVMLSSEEALATLLSLAISEKLRLPMFALDLGKSRRKIMDAFPGAERRRIAPLRERVFVGRPASATVRGSYGTPAPAPIRRLQAAFVDQRIVRAVYVREDGRSSERRVEPHAIVISWPAWYLLAFDHQRGAPRTFRFDRFVEVEVETETFRPRPRDLARQLLEDPRVAIEAL